MALSRRFSLFGFMSAIGGKADSFEGRAPRLLMTPSGHGWMVARVVSVGRLFLTVRHRSVQNLGRDSNRSNARQGSDTCLVYLV